MSREQMLRELRADLATKGAHLHRDDVLIRLDAILDEPALPWVSVEERMPEEADADESGDVFWGDSRLQESWRGWYRAPDRADHWMPTDCVCAIPLPEGE